MKTLMDYRKQFMGIAILMVLLYHLYCCLPNIEVLHLFKYCYGGVDVFMLVSGYGLCFSYKKNSIKDFYIHRM